MLFLSCLAIFLGNKNLNHKGINLDKAYDDYVLNGWLFTRNP